MRDNLQKRNHALAIAIISVLLPLQYGALTAQETAPTDVNFVAISADHLKSYAEKPEVQNRYIVQRQRFIDFHRSMYKAIDPSKLPALDKLADVDPTTLFLSPLWDNSSGEATMFLAETCIESLQQAVQAAENYDLDPKKPADKLAAKQKLATQANNACRVLLVQISAVSGLGVIEKLGKRTTISFVTDAAEALNPPGGETRTAYLVQSWDKATRLYFVEYRYAIKIDQREFVRGKDASDLIFQHHFLAKLHSILFHEAVHIALTMQYFKPLITRMEQLGLYSRPAEDASDSDIRQNLEKTAAVFRVEIAKFERHPAVRALNEYFTHQVNALAMNTLGIAFDPAQKSSTFNWLNRYSAQWGGTFLDGSTKHLDETEQRQFLERATANALPPEEWTSDTDSQTAPTQFAKMLVDPHFRSMGELLAELYEISRSN